MRAPINGGPPQIVLEAPAIGNYECSHAPAAICAFGQENPKELVISVFDPAIGKPHEVAKLAAVTFGATDNRIRLLSLGSDHSRAYGEKLDWLHFHRLGGRFQRAFCQQPSRGLEAKLAVHRFSGQCTSNLGSEPLWAYLGHPLAQWKVRRNSSIHFR